MAGTSNSQEHRRGRPGHRGPWTASEIARQQSADQAQVQRDRARGVAANLREAAALARFANRFAAAFRHVRGA